MSNTISFDGAIASDADLHMPNLGTNVFINVLVLSGSELAQTESEKRFVIYLAEKIKRKLAEAVWDLICNFPRCKIHGIFLTCFGC